MNKTIDLYWNDFIEGDKQAFEQIYRVLLPSLYEYGMRRVKDEDYVRDSIQDIFIKFWENRSKLKSISNPKHYLLVALKNSLLNTQLRDGRLSSFGEKDDFQLTYDVESNYIAAEEQRGNAFKLIQALEQLTGKQKEVIFLRYFEELSYEEISAMTNISVKGLYKLNNRAMEALKDIMGMPKQNLLVLLYMIKFLYS
ncbi:sigma-70 family RNA polymerase sigma factor [Sphingobacterium sp.]|jgi:RNA polymerase sigma factor (sigma-70 family)|uniref:RNA polymerase sigma factor n=1 Tax=Sphingobacterium sp. TaxID=341027 RepID=UPI0028A2702F|nr:sigma-70 family RNA polymerase sigma factor [Sphingobacterium sp.]